MKIHLYLNICFDLTILLQTLQNTASRLAPGCVKISAIGHLHAGSSVLPVRDHLSLFSHLSHLSSPTPRSSVSFTCGADLPGQPLSSLPFLSSPICPTFPAPPPNPHHPLASRRRTPNRRREAHLDELGVKQQQPLPPKKCPFSKIDFLDVSDDFTYFTYTQTWLSPKGDSLPFAGG